PDDRQAWSGLGECQLLQERVDEAITSWKEALRLDPTSATDHAHLGDAYAIKRDLDRALAELREAERLGPEDLDTEQILAKAYDDLHDDPDCVEHAERFIRLARKRGVNPRIVDQTEELTRAKLARLTPFEVAATMPKVYS